MKIETNEKNLLGELRPLKLLAVQCEIFALRRWRFRGRTASRADQLRAVRKSQPADAIGDESSSLSPCGGADVVRGLDYRIPPMSDASETCALFERWEKVWHEGQYDLIPSCVGSHYIRHDEKGDRTVTREAYTSELAAIHGDRPGIRVVVYDHTFTAHRAWFRFSFKWKDSKTGEPQSRSGMQSYRTEAGRLAETWISLLPIGTDWTDAVARKSWTSET